MGNKVAAATWKHEELIGREFKVHYSPGKPRECLSKNKEEPIDIGDDRSSAG